MEPNGTLIHGRGYTIRKHITRGFEREDNSPVALATSPTATIKTIIAHENSWKRATREENRHSSSTEIKRK